MMQAPYATPQANLNQKKDSKDLTASERLAQSRRDLEEASAINILNYVWGIRLFFDTAAIVTFVALFIGGFSLQAPDMITLFGIMVLFLLGEIISIIGYFRRKKWSKLALSIFSGFSLLNFPGGTVLSIIHYLNVGKLQFQHEE